MNYLAHVYLSYKQPGLIIGNMIGDFVKGNQYLNYPENIQKGILLHRQIDSYTDIHPIIQSTKQIFRSSVGRYDGAFLDVAYDYYLANDPQLLSEREWKQIITQAYATVDMHIGQLPPHFQRMFSYMENGDWLYNYRYAWQIKKSFRGLVERAKYLNKDAHPFVAFEENFAELEQSFERFFPDLESFVMEWIQKNHINLQ